VLAHLLAAKIIIGLLLIGCEALGNDLPNDCAILATEANARLATSAAWSQVLFIQVFDFKKLRTFGHALAVWQIHKDGAIIVYDGTGAADLKTHSHQANDIAVELNKLNPTQPIFEAHFIQ